MEELQVSITHLTGAMNTVLDQLRGFETRIVVLEQVGTQETIQKILEQLGSIKDKIKSVEENTPSVVASCTQPDLTVEPLRGPSNENELREISKLPDPVKEIQVFDGNPVQYVSWVHCVETVLKDYEIVRSKPLYRAILQHIRQKIRGKADSALVSYNVFDNDWTEIKKILSLHYADKRDIRTLEHQLNQLKQGSLRVDDFYANVNHQFSLIINKIRTDTYSVETANALIGTYRDRALDVFVRGLSGDLSRLLMIQKPKSLPEAYTTCLDMQNINLRNSSVHVQAPNTVSAPVSYDFGVEKKPSLPTRNLNRYPNRFGNGRGGSAQFRHNTLGPSYNSKYYQHPTGPKPPVKMELGSEQTRNVDYMNRPSTSNPFKRGSSSEGYQRKQQRLNHMVAGAPEAVEESSCSNTTTPAEENFMTEASFPAYHI